MKLLAFIASSMGLLGVGMTIDETTAVPVGLVAGAFVVLCTLVWKGAARYFAMRSLMRDYQRRIRALEKRAGIEEDDDESSKPDPE